MGKFKIPFFSSIFSKGRLVLALVITSVILELSTFVHEGSLGPVHGLDRQALALVHHLHHGLKSLAQTQCCQQ